MYMCIDFSQGQRREEVLNPSDSFQSASVHPLCGLQVRKLMEREKHSLNTDLTTTLCL